MSFPNFFNSAATSLILRRRAWLSFCACFNAALLIIIFQFFIDHFRFPTDDDFCAYALSPQIMNDLSEFQPIINDILAERITKEKIIITEKK